MQKFCSVRELSSMPKPPPDLFDLSRLTDEQVNELTAIMAQCSPDQLAVLEKIVACQPAVHMVHRGFLQLNSSTKQSVRDAVAKSDTQHTALIDDVFGKACNVMFVRQSKVIQNF